VRLLSLIIALLLTVGGLYLAMAGGNSALDYFSALSDSQQRVVSGAMVVFTILMLSIAGIARRRQSAKEKQTQ